MHPFWMHPFFYYVCCMAKNAYNTILRELILQLFDQHPRWHGYDIVKTLQEKSNGNIDIKENRLYPALHKLEAEGVLESELVSIGNRNRKYYTLTEMGSPEVNKATSKLTEMASALQMLLKSTSHAK